MSIPYTCPECGFQGKAADELAGQQGSCPKCKQSIAIDSIDWAIDDSSPPAKPDSSRQILQLLNDSAQRRDELLLLIANRLWWVALWTFLLLLLFLIGCPTIVAEIRG